ncbi:MAG: hypothetical protein WDO15_10110 [Bacteroidota bacterium]
METLLQLSERERSPLPRINPAIAHYNAAAAVQRDLIINKLTQTITFGPLTSKPMGIIFPFNHTATSKLRFTSILFKSRRWHCIDQWKYSDTRRWRNNQHNGKSAR